MRCLWITLLSGALSACVSAESGPGVPDTAAARTDDIDAGKLSALYGWPGACNRFTGPDDEPRARLTMVPDGSGNAVLVVDCTPGVNASCSLVYPFDPDSPAPAKALQFYQVVDTADGRRLVKDRWICGRGGVTTPANHDGVIAFEQSRGPGGCGLLNSYSIADMPAETDGARAPLWPTVRALSCSPPDVHRRRQQGVDYASPFDWPLLDNYRALPKIAPFVEQHWFPELSADGAG